MTETLVGRSTYLTVRCPTGCEAWLHPKAVHQHLAGRCRGHPWVEDLPDTAVIPEPYTELILSAIDDTLVSVVPPDRSGRVDPSDGRVRNQPRPHKGTRRIQSPIEGIKARRWLLVAVAAAERWGDDGVRTALDPQRFQDLEGELVAPESYNDCPICGTFVSTRSLRTHQRTSANCLWRHAASEVQDAWLDGWRDPWSIPGAPLTWSELTSTAALRRSLRTITFPRWIAVLLPPQECEPRSLD